MAGLADVIRGYQMYLRRMHAETDPLVARGGRVQAPATGDVGGGLEVTKTGPRAGQLRQTITLGGSRYHLYYDRAGRRRVFRVSGPPTREPDVIGTGL